jgi:cobalt-zinc-cadmium efflux system outer membrane protein
MKLLLGLTASIALVRCASISKEAGHSQVASLVEARTGQKTHWEHGPPQGSAVSARVDELLKPGLTRNGAMEIALLNNPALQATYEELGISQAEMVQAGLIRNPRIAGHVGLPVSAGVAELEFSIFQELLDLLMLPSRKRIAGEQFQAEILRVAHEALNVASEVSKEFASLQAAERLVELRRIIVESTQASAELAQRQYEAGNIPELSLAIERVAYEQAKLDLGREELELFGHREKINQLLGLWGGQTQWTLSEKLPELPSEEVPVQHLESLAMRQRLDVDAARKQSALLAAGVNLAKAYRFLGTVELGVVGHRDAEGSTLIGPTLMLELPIFDQRQAVIARLEAQQRQSERRLAAISITARSNVRVAQSRLGSARQIVEHYRSVLLPLREKAVQLSQLQYNAMQIGLYQLLAAKQAQVNASREYIEAIRDYWMARAELERVVGGRLSSAAIAQGEPALPAVVLVPREKDRREAQ